jgi:hypothetical protein
MLQIKRIINWCSGGIGNRLRPLASCHAVSKVTGRKLSMCWQPTMRCMTHFNDLFLDDIEMLSYDDISKLENVSIYSEAAYIRHDASLNGNPALLNLFNKFGCKTLDQTVHIGSDEAQNIIVYDNNFFGSFDITTAHTFIKSLIPLDIIQKKIDDFLNINPIDKTWIGVHARGTDFEPSGVNVHTYINRMQQYSGRNFFVCSDSLDYENTMKQTMPNVLFYKKDSYVSRGSAAGWHNNVITPMESVQDSLLDIYLLSKTDIQIYNTASTFAEIAKILS